MNIIGRVHCKYKRNILLHETVYYHCVTPFQVCLHVCACVCVCVWFLFYFEGVNVVHFQTMSKCKAQGTHHHVVSVALVLRCSFSA